MTAAAPAAAAVAAVATSSAVAAASAVARVWRGVRWYLREVSGESAYDRYVETACRNHPDDPILDRRTFERRRQDRDNQLPQQRCC